jgi:hypothetical protein
MKSILFSATRAPTTNGSMLVSRRSIPRMPC